MKITYISHATLLIEVDNIRIITDPWVTGSSYCDQWHIFPKPLSPGLINDADFVLYSHGHEDHLHAESLSLINKTAKVFYPYSWFDGAVEFFNSMGFYQFKEVLNEQCVQLSDKVKVTYLSNNLDNIMVIESEDTVLVNINDALHSASAKMIAYFIEKLNKRWPKIDYVFSSYGGASYFPNTVHFQNKNDHEIAEVREEFFLDNFCKIVNGLSPKIAVPFASDFVLLDDNQRWINHTKFPRNKIPETFAKKYPTNTAQVIESYPDDFFERKTFYRKSTYHAIAQDLVDRIDEDYKEEIKRKRAVSYLSATDLQNCFEKVKKHITQKQYIIPAPIRKSIKFSIKIVDALRNNILTVDFRGDDVNFAISDKQPENIDLSIELKSTTILYSIDNEWGGDAIIIGYGAEIFVHNEEVIKLEIENYCVRLLSRYPNTKEHLKRSPIRTARYLWSDSTKRNNLLYRALGQQEKIINYLDPVLTDRNIWLTKDKCEVCKACNL